jgi:hypothetical protein
MELEKVKKAIDSMVGYPKMTGIMGGEPLLHPEFFEICKYMQTKIPKAQCGLWTCLPKGKEHYREVIVETFGNIFINDHTRDDILHGPVLVSATEMDIPNWEKDHLIDKCWVQNSWSASINEKGAWFCEVAASLATLLNKEGLAWPVEQAWWARTSKYFVDQMKMCNYCGCAMPLKRRPSVEEIDDISPKIFDMIKDTSPKIKKGKYEISKMEVCVEEPQEAAYKNADYRKAIAKRYGMFLVVNDLGFNEPYLLKI